MRALRARVSVKIGLAVAALVVAVAFGQWLSFRTVLEAHHRSIRDSTLEPGIALAQRAVRWEEGRASLPDLATRADPGFALALYDDRGVLLDTSAGALEIPTQLPEEVLRRTEARVHSFEHIYEPTLTSDTGVIAILDGGGPASGGAPRYVAFFEVAAQRAWARVRLESLVLLLLFLPFAALATTFVLARVIRTRIRRAQQVVHRIAEGDLEVRLPPLSDDEVGELVSDFNRMTDRLEALVSTMREQEGQRRRLFAAFTHELNTPLTNVLGYLESLQLSDVDEDPDTRRRYVSVAFEQARALESLAADIETLSRLDFEGVKLEREDHDLVELTRAQIAALARRAEARGVRLEVVVPEDTPALLASVDALRVGQVLRNVLDNAIRHSPADEAVTVHVRGDEREVSVEIRDLGDGIAAEHLAHLGEPLYRVDPSRTRGTGGRGLGIAIARGLAQAHGGSLEIESEVGRGTAVRIVVPRAT